jgi:hypothetical protein
VPVLFGNIPLPFNPEVYMDEFTSFVNNYTDQLLLGAAVVAIILIPVIGYVLHKAKKVPGEEPPMKKETYVLTKRQQRRQESSLVSDGIEALLMDMYAKGQLTDERYISWHVRFQKRMGLLDLQNKPITLTSDMKKQNAKARLDILKKEPKPTLPKEAKKPKNAIEAALQAV